MPLSALGSLVNVVLFEASSLSPRLFIPTQIQDYVNGLCKKYLDVSHLINYLNVMCFTLAICSAKKNGDSLQSQLSKT